jgi:hypothetical protein
MEQTARGSGDLCEHKQRLQLDGDWALGELTMDKALERMRKGECSRFRDTGAFYGKLAQQLGAFGLALVALADAGETDYTEKLSEITATDQVLEVTGLSRERVEAANGLGNKLLQWFTAGYASSKISEALTDSKKDVTETLALLEVVLGAYDGQVNGYSQAIDQIATDADFTTRRDGESDAVFEARKAAQAALIKEHEPIAQERARVLTACREALVSVREVHTELVDEATRKREQFDLPSLVKRARALAGEVAELRKLVEEVAGS